MISSTPLDEGLDLLAHVGAAVDGHEAVAPGLHQRVHHLGDLQGQLPGGDHDERTGARGSAGSRRSMSGRPKARVLPEPGLGLAADVAAGHGVGDGQALDGEGLGDPLLGEALHEVGGDAERVEGGGGVGDVTHV
jgi:hypothetical protein